MGAEQYCALTTTESRAKIWRQKNHFSPNVAQAAVRSKAVVLLLLTYCLMYFSLFRVGVCVCLCVGMHYFVSFLVLQSSSRERASWLLCFYCLTVVLVL